MANFQASTSVANAPKATQAIEQPLGNRERFIAAYDVEFQEWINEVVGGATLTGPSSWDGYAAQAVCDAGVKSLYSGDRIEIELGTRPALYS